MRRRDFIKLAANIGVVVAIPSTQRSSETVWSNQAPTFITFPPGVTTGKRLTINENGIFAYNASNEITFEVDVSTTSELLAPFIVIADPSRSTYSSGIIERSLPISGFIGSGILIQGRISQNGINTNYANVLFQDGKAGHSVGANQDGATSVIGNIATDAGSTGDESFIAQYDDNLSTDAKVIELTVESNSPNTFDTGIMVRDPVLPANLQSLVTSKNSPAVNHDRLQIGPGLPGGYYYAEATIVSVPGIPNNAFTLVPINNVPVCYTNLNSGNAYLPNPWTCLETGLYLFEFHLKFVNSLPAGATMELAICRGALSFNNFIGFYGSTNTVNGVGNASALKKINAGETIAFYAYQNSGTAQTIVNDDVTGISIYKML